MSDQTSHVTYHVAPVANRPHVFASVEYPKGEPPKEIVIDGKRWVLSTSNETKG